MKWFLEQCDGVDIAVLKHPMRNTIREEAQYLKDRIALERKDKVSRYVISRYDNELIDEQLKAIFSDTSYVDDCVFASTAFVYKNCNRLQMAMKEWWFHTSRYHLIDQLSFPYVLKKNECTIKVIPTKKHHDFRIPYLTLTRYL